MSPLADDITLTESLRFAVPLHLAELLTRPARDQAATARWWAADAARAVGERGDLLQFVSRSSSARPKVANTFQHLARGLAALVVLHPAGVDVAGLHWCLQPDCDRCHPDRPTAPVDDLVAQLEAIDADYRRLAGLPPYRAPEPPPAPAPVVPAARRPVITLHLLEAL